MRLHNAPADVEYLSKKLKLPQEKIKMVKQVLCNSRTWAEFLEYTMKLFHVLQKICVSCLFVTPLSMIRSWDF